ncbi:MAG: SAM-dependent chlorinase/fluorinase [Deltaproteobacteria bacterium]|nr:SAM-dependent chlorinase/fluorinase [Deltaproteobacteria bacterium]
MNKAPIVLLSDFGDSHYAGQMRGVILGIAAGAPIADLTHSISPQNVVEAAHILSESVGAFPEGSIFVCVVDPGVGTKRRGIAIEAARRRFVGPDNGVFSLVARGGVTASAVLENPRYFRPGVCATFHGRDVFAPVAAHLWLGVGLEDLGPPAGQIEGLRFPTPVVSEGRIDAHVLYADRFGNLVTDVEAGLVAGGRWAVLVHGKRIRGVSRTYADGVPGKPMALLGSSGRVEIAVRDGSAAERFHVKDPRTVRVRLIKAGKDRVQETS